MLDHTSIFLASCLATEGVETSLYHTGGGCMVLRVFQDEGKEVWLTRDENEWVLGFYDTEDDADEGHCVFFDVYRNGDAVEIAVDCAEKVAGILRVMGKIPNTSPIAA